MTFLAVGFIVLMTCFCLGVRTAKAEENPLKWEQLTSKHGHLPVAGPPEQTACLVLDADKDGVDDIIIACRKEAPAVTWFRQTRHGWMRTIIEPAFLTLEAGGAFFDIDGDGDLDIVFGGDWQSNEVYWWENPYPDFDPNVPWKRHLIKTGGGHQHHDQIFGDFDGDGKVELVFWNQGAKTLFWARIPDDPRTARAWPCVPIYSGPGEGLAKGDLNGDGKDELLAGGAWFEYRGGTEFVRHVIDPSQAIPRIAVGHLKPGGIPQVVMVPGDAPGRLRWYECTGDPTDTTAWATHELLDDDVWHGHSLELADFNGDGHLDIFCGEMREIQRGANQNPDATMWVFLGDGQGNFQKTVVSVGNGVHEAKIGDLDGDGRPDICAKPYCWDTPRLDIWFNRTPR